MGNYSTGSRERIITITVPLVIPSHAAALASSSSVAPVAETAAGENTLEAQLVRVLMRSIVESGSVHFQHLSFTL